MVTCHFLKDFTLRRATLGVIAVAGQQTSETLKNVINKQFSKFSEKTNFSATVVDNEMMPTAIKVNSAGDVVSCYIHTIQLCIEDVIDKELSVEDIKIVHEILGKIKISRTLRDQLRTLEKTDDVTIALPVDTRLIVFGSVSVLGTDYCGNFWKFMFWGFILWIFLLLWILLFLLWWLLEIVGTFIIVEAFLNCVG